MRDPNAIVNIPADRFTPSFQIRFCDLYASCICYTAAAACYGERKYEETSRGAKSAYVSWGKPEHFATLT